MKFAIVDGVKHTPQKGLKGKCISCGSDMVSKCGDIRIKHWAHKGKKHCDPWWENETEWHRDWKNLFPVEWQEIRCVSENGEIHIADIKRPDGFFIEVQNSPINSLEVDARNNFYKNLIWVINGCRYQLDVESLSFYSNTIKKDGYIEILANTFKICTLWKNRSRHVFVDFCDYNHENMRRVFYLSSSDNVDLLIEMTVVDFVSCAKVPGGLKTIVDKARLYKEKAINEKNLLKEAAREEQKKKLEWEKKHITPFLRYERRK
jgi:competence CoiA-like predicted nuclease